MSTGSDDRGAYVVTVRQPGRVTLHLVVVDRLPIGRAGDGLVLADDRVSRHHCELRVVDGALTVRDTGSSNGTLVNGAVVSGRRALRAGDVVELGDTVIIVGLTADAVPEPAEPFDDLGATTVGSLEPATDTEQDEPTDSLRASIVGTTLTLVFSDIVDSTSLVHRHGDQLWLALLGRHDEITLSNVERFHGTQVKGQGDGFLLTFPSARHALLFSIAVQRDLLALRSDDPTFPIRVRLGIHTGEVLHAAGDVFGRHVHRAARISAIAGPDEIVASSLVHELAESMGDIRFGPAEIVDLRGFDAEQVVHRVLWSP